MWPYPRILAHRGAGQLAPENTLAAFRCGLEHGFRAVEFDVMLARDGVPVVLHDDELGRTVAGRGSVAAHDAAALARMDAGSWFGPAYAGEPVPLYAEVLEFCQRHGIWMNVEIKPVPGFEEQTGRVVAELTRAAFGAALGGGPGRLPLISSFQAAAVAAARAAAPEIARAILFERVPEDWRAVAASLDVVAIHCNHRYLTPALARAIGQSGLGLFCYTVNAPERARELFAWGVDGFCTDRLDLFPPGFA
jgi:glycerophosphoryl diester phosphodiesterase